MECTCTASRRFVRITEQCCPDRCPIVNLPAVRYLVGPFREHQTSLISMFSSTSPPEFVHELGGRRAPGSRRHDPSVRLAASAWMQGASPKQEFRPPLLGQFRQWLLCFQQLRVLHQLRLGWFGDLWDFGPKRLAIASRATDRKSTRLNSSH